MCKRYDVLGTARSIQLLILVMFFFEVLGVILSLIFDEGDDGSSRAIRLLRVLRLAVVLLNIIFYFVLCRYICIFKTKIPRPRLFIACTIGTFLIQILDLFVEASAVGGMLGIVVCIFYIYVCVVMHQIRADPENQSSEENFHIIHGMYTPLADGPRVEAVMVSP